MKKRIEEAHRRGQKIDGDAYAARLVLELGVIQKMQFSGYFLIVWDFIRYAKEQRIPVGPGRGSGAGSLVAYCLRITDIDPIEHKLLFERFLNPERVSMPDFDIDFCMNRRDQVISYVTDKYGKDNVGQIITMHQIKARSGVRDIGRAMALPFADVDRIAKFVPEPVQASPPHRRGHEQEPRLKQLYARTRLSRAPRRRQVPGWPERARRQPACRIRDRRRSRSGSTSPVSAPRARGIVTHYDKIRREGGCQVRLPGIEDADVIQTALDLINRDNAGPGRAGAGPDAAGAGDDASSG